MKAVDIRNGAALKIDGKIYIVTKSEHRTPGNLRAFVQAKMKDIVSGSYIEKRFASTEEVEDTVLDRRQAEYLYPDGDGYVFMDSETFDQFTLFNEIVGDAMPYLAPNTSTEVLFHEDKPVLVNLPSAVDLTVAETQPGIKGATATNQLKEAVMETGLKTRVPPFIEEGEVLRINTADGSYISRVKD
ncbi:MAG: elongation factor P [Phycisphaerales bacterium]